MSTRPFILVLAACVGLVAGLAWWMPAPVDWSDSFETGDARPYGSETVRAVLPDLFAPGAVQTVEVPPYLHLRDRAPAGGAYLFVTDRFAPGPEETGRLLDYARRGNTVFVAAHEVDGAWADSLALTTRRLRPSLPIPSAEVDTAFARLSGLDAPVPLREDAVTWAVRTLDTARTAVWGTVQTDDGEVPAFVRTRVGRGQVILNTLPRAFTNVHLLQPESARYVYAALSHLPASTTPVWWDAYHKPGRAQAQTPLRFVTSHPALRNALGWAVLGILLFIGVQGRRRQRPIPVIEPPANQTVEFVKTVGRLYHRQGDHRGLARKRIRYLLAGLQTDLGVATGPLDDAWVQAVHQRTGVPRPTVQALVDAIHTARHTDPLPADALRTLDRRIQTFHDARER